MMSSAVPSDWRSRCTIGWKRWDGTGRHDFWVRWTSPDGLYFWLHPVANRWVGEPDQVHTPDFETVGRAKAALLNAPEPPGSAERDDLTHKVREADPPHLMRRLVILILPLVFLAGCAAVAAQAPDGTRFAAVTLWKDPTFKGLHYASTQATFDLGDYNSVSRFTGADLASLAVMITKLLLVLP